MNDTPDLLHANELAAAVHAALAAWDEPGGSEASLLGSLLLVRQMRAAQGDDRSPAALRRATNRVLSSAFDELASQDQTGAAVLRARFAEGAITRAVAQQLHASHDQVNRWQRTAIQRLAAILAARESALRQARIAHHSAELPPPSYTRLFGVEQAQALLDKKLAAAGPPWIVVIGGIGGIGKTSLADAVTRHAIAALAYERIIWLRAEGHSLSGAPLAARQQAELLLAALDERLSPADAAGQLPEQARARVQRALKTAPHLVVVDNLEAVDDAADLLARLAELVDPSRFLVTTRARPPVAAAYYYALEELPPADAAELLRHHAATIGVNELAEANAASLDAIYQVTGGNPLALKLVVSLAGVLPLAQILADLACSRPGPVEALYRHIYWQAWHSLSPAARALLQAMPLAAEAGALPEQMQAMSALSEAEFWPAVAELVARSLLEVRGSVQERRYGIHRLTASFLLTEIVHWPEE